MERLGEFLKKGREHAGMSLEDLAASTRIRLQNLEALEGEDLDALPNELYVRGFVKLVCREIGLVPEEGLLRYETLKQRAVPEDAITWEEERSVVEPGALERALGDPDRLVRQARSAAKWGGIALGGALTVFLVTLGIRAVDFGARDADAGKMTAALEADSPPPAPAGAPSPERTESVPIVPVESESDPAPDPEPAVPAEDTSTPEPALKLPELVEIEIPDTQILRALHEPPVELTVTRPDAAVPDAPPGEADAGRAAEKAGARAETVRAPDPVEVEATKTSLAEASEPAVDPQLEIDSTPTVSGAEPLPAHREFVGASVRGTEKLVLQLEALRPVDVTVFLDGGGHPREKTLAPGDVKRWKADKLFLVSATDAGAIRIYLQGEDLGVPGPDLVPLKLGVVRPRNR